MHWRAFGLRTHEGLEKLFVGHPPYRGKKRSQLLAQLRVTIDGQEHRAQKSAERTRFAVAQSRFHMTPARSPA
jgi:hypothetical protein